MKTIIKTITGMLLTVSFLSCATQIKNAKKETYKVAGNCDMCKENIETAANQKGKVEASWNVDSKMLAVTYDSVQTTADEILKRIAYAGYDNEKFLAPQEAYDKLAKCCQYDRLKKEDHTEHEATTPTTTTDEHQHDPEVTEPATNENGLHAILNDYFSVKDALVKSDPALAASKALALSKAIKAVKMDQLTTEQHTIWMKVEKELLTQAEHIAETKDLEHQRGHLAIMATAMYHLAKTVKTDETIYYQHCPMYNDGKGANWLSQEKAIKNPFYGSAMLSCGKTVETLK